MLSWWATLPAMSEGEALTSEFVPVFALAALLVVFLRRANTDLFELLPSLESGNHGDFDIVVCGPGGVQLRSQFFSVDAFAAVARVDFLA